MGSALYSVVWVPLRWVGKWIGKGIIIVWDAFVWMGKWIWKGIIAVWDAFVWVISIFWGTGSIRLPRGASELFENPPNLSSKNVSDLYEIF